MVASYAVCWQEGDHAVGSGRLVLEPGRIRLGAAGGVELAIPLGEVAAAAIHREACERLRGLPVLRVERYQGAPVRIASVIGAGALIELADAIVQLAAS